jgi:peptidoglycan/LPS O-acetylase OafA/YrhL
MYITNLSFIFSGISVAVLTAYLLLKAGAPQPPPTSNRYAAIDGLRGYLALFVFLNHAIHWLFYIQTGKWESPELGSNMYDQFGLYYQLGWCGVSMFFMITGFLFSSKLLNEREKGIDWIKLYTSRFLRITPLYICAILLVFCLVAIESNFALNVPLPDLFTQMLHWVSFTTFGMPKINGIEAAYMTASVTWTLVYEWLFYLSLPMLALVLRTKVALLYVVISFLIVFTITANMETIYRPLAFLSGILCSIIVRVPVFRALMQHQFFSIIAIACVFGMLFFYSDMRGILRLTCLTIAFAIIASGNDLFGMLSNAASRLLGEVSYGIYLLHGLVFYCSLKYVIGFEKIKAMDMISYCSLMCVLAVALIIISSLTYQLIEKPAMNRVASTSAWIKKYLSINSLKFRWSAFGNKKTAH